MVGKKMLVVSAHPGDVLWRCSGAIGKRTQLGGTVIDSVCRDVPVIRQLNYPIFTKGRYVVTGKGQVYADRVNEPVLSISGIQVRRGDLVVADDSGALCVPVEAVEQVLEIVREVDRAEQAIVQRIQNGLSLRDARREMGYHSLQTRVKP